MVRFVLVFFLLMLSFNTTAKEASCSAQLIPDVSDGQVIKPYLESLKQTTLFSNENVNGSYCNLHAYYLDKSPWKFYATRVLSILIILLGAMLPVVAVFPTFFKDQRVWTVGIGAAIVLSQGVLQTFHFEQSWRGQIVAQLELESALRQWQLSVVNLDENSPEALESLKKATLDFDKQVSSIVMNETSGFFDNVSKGTGALGSGGK